MLFYVKCDIIKVLATAKIIPKGKMTMQDFLKRMFGLCKEVEVEVVGEMPDKCRECVKEKVTELEENGNMPLEILLAVFGANCLKIGGWEIQRQQSGRNKKITLTALSEEDAKRKAEEMN